MASEGVIFFAPNLGAFLAPKTLPFFGPADGPLRTAAAVRIAAGGGGASLLSVPDRGDFGLAVSLPLVPALRNGEAVRLTTGGVAGSFGGGVGGLLLRLFHQL